MSPFKKLKDLNAEVISNLLNPKQQQITFKKLCTDQRYARLFDSNAQQVKALSSSTPLMIGTLSKENDKYFFRCPKPPPELQNNHILIIYFESIFAQCQTKRIMGGKIEIGAIDARFHKRVPLTGSGKVWQVGLPEIEKITSGETLIQREHLIQKEGRSHLISDLVHDKDSGTGKRPISNGSPLVNINFNDISQGGCSLTVPGNMKFKLNDPKILFLEADLNHSGRESSLRCFLIIRHVREHQGELFLGCAFIEVLARLPENIIIASREAEDQKLARPKTAGMKLEELDMSRHKRWIKRYSITSPKGLLVTDILSNSPAEVAGLKRGDVMLTVDKKGIKKVAEFEESYKDSRKILIKMERGGSYFFASLQNKVLPKKAA